MSKKKLALVGFLFAILLVIPLTVYLVQQQQQSQSKAAPNTRLSFSPADQTASIGGKVSFDVIVDPGNNQVNFIKLVLKYDSTKLQASETSFKLDPASNLSVIQGPVVGTDNISVSLSVQNDPTKVLQTSTKIGTVTFDVIAASDVPTTISFDSQQIQVRSINGANQDSFNENVFLQGDPASITIQGAETPTPSPSAEPTPSLEPSVSPSEEPSPSDTPTPSPTPDLGLGGGASSSANTPVCDSLTANSTQGAAPFSLTLTANGTASEGTISKATFNFGDGVVEDVTSAGGIGTNNVSVEKSHIYETAGTFNATAALTDDQDNVSDTDACTIAITVDAADASASGTPTTLPDTGPRETLLGLGALGGILVMIGAFLFFVL